MLKKNYKNGGDKKKEKGCDHCAGGFEIIQKISDEHLTECPQCGAKLIKLISAPAIGGSQSNFDERAKNAGFTKLKKLGKGEYEKQY